MIVFPDSSVETEYTDPNGSVWQFNGTGWVRDCDCDGSGGGNPDVEPPDEHWAETYLLINCDDMADGSQDFVDATGKQTITVFQATGWPKALSAAAKYGTAGMESRLTGATFLRVPMFDLTKPWTVESWAKWGVVVSSPGSAPHTLCGLWGPVPGHSFRIYATNTDQRWRAELSWDNKATIAELVGPPGSALWKNGEYQHIALSWDGDAYRFFIDGVLVDVEVQDKPLTAPLAPDNFQIFGAQSNGNGSSNYFFDGWLDDFRITEGVCRYTDTFTPPGKLSTDPALRKAIIVDGDEAELLYAANDADLTNNVTTEE